MSHFFPNLFLQGLGRPEVGVTPFSFCYGNVRVIFFFLLQTEAIEAALAI